MGACLGGCGLNPAFNNEASGEATATGSSSSGASSTTAQESETSSGSGSPTSTEVAGTSTEDALTEAVVDTTSDGSSTGTTTAVVDTTSADDESTGEPSCWEAGVQGWAPGMKVEGLTGSNARAGTLSADGLTLHYVAADPGRLFRATRDPGAAFVGGEQLTIWPNLLAFNADHPAVTRDGSRIFFHYQNVVNGMVFEVGMGLQYVVPEMVNPFEKYSQPKPVTISPGEVPDEIPAVSADGKMLLLQRQDGGALPGLEDGKGWRFHQFEYQADWVYLGERTPANGALDLALCPALSADGLRLFYTSTMVGDLNADNANQVTGVWYTQRSDPKDKWEAPLEVTGLDEEGSVPCPRAVTEDGCTLMYTRFVFGGGDLGMFLSDR